MDHKQVTAQESVDNEAWTASEYIDACHNNNEYDYWFDEMYWKDDFDDELLWKNTLASAAKEGVTIIDAQDFDYPTYFWELYQAAEKGLS